MQVEVQIYQVMTLNSEDLRLEQVEMEMRQTPGIGRRYIKDETGNEVTGWRIFDIEGDNVTLISAGNPEAYYSVYGIGNLDANTYTRSWKNC